MNVTNTGMDPNNYIQSIIDQASSGDTIKILAAQYNHIHLTINKALNIVSEVGTKIYACPTESLEGSDQKVAFLITGNGSGTNISGFNIINNDVNGYGILLNNTTNVNIKNNTINSQGSGVKVVESSNISIEKNNISGSKNGISISNSSNTKIKNNTLTNNNVGLNYTGNISQNEIVDNDISNNKRYGISIEGISTNTNIKNNKLNSNNDNNGYTLDAGIFINESFSNLNIISNIITNNGKYGILIDGGANKDPNLSKQSDIHIDYNYIGDNGDPTFTEYPVGYTGDKEIVWFQVYPGGARHPFEIGPNYYGKTNPALCASTYTGLILLNISQTSSGLYKITYNIMNGTDKRPSDVVLGVATEMMDHYLTVYLNKGTPNEVKKDILIKNGVGIADFRESTFQNSNNTISLHSIYTSTFNVSNNAIPKKSVSIISTAVNKVKQGKLIKYSITVKNNGDKILKNINIKQLVPNFKINRFTLNTGKYSAKSKIWTINSLKAGQTATLNIYALPTKYGTYTNTAVLSSENLIKKSNTMKVKVEKSPVISYVNYLTKKSKKNKAFALKTKIKNTGSLSSKKVRVKIALPSKMKVQAVNYKKYYNKKTKIWTIRVPAGKSVTLSMKVKGSKKGSKKILFNNNGAKTYKSIKIV